jgi:transposase
MNTNYKNENFLFENYVNKKISIAEISKQCGVGESTIKT